MKIQTLLLLLPILLLSACSEDNAQQVEATDKVLLLRVDYLTNNFEAGKELVFEGEPTTFTVSDEYVEPGDFGYLKLFYDEKDELLFHGEIHWNGLGSLIFPQEFIPASQFDYVMTEDFAYPAAGFENVFNPNNDFYNYDAMWIHIQALQLVRQYLLNNPAATVKVFLYTPSVGMGDPAEWDWYFILKN